MERSSAAAAQSPLLSVVVVIVSDTTDQRQDVAHLAGCLQSLAEQVEAPPMEIIVPYAPPVEGIEDLQRHKPQVVFVPVDDLRAPVGGGASREHHDELRARGLELAKGDLVGLLEDHSRPDPHWSARAVKGHSHEYRDYAGVGGAIENGVDRSLNWAVYFCDFAKYQNPVTDGESAFASDANVIYKRSALDAIRPVWQESFHETAVNWALASRGERLALSCGVVVFQRREHLQLASAIKERFVWGRSYAGTRSRLLGGAKRWVCAAAAPVIPGVLTGRMALGVLRKGRNRGAFLKALPLIGLLTVSWSLGEWLGYVTACAYGSTLAGDAQPVTTDVAAVHRAGPLARSKRSDGLEVNR